MSEDHVEPGYEFVKSASGAIEGLSVKVAHLPPPERTFSATWAGAVSREDDVELSFAQVLPGGEVGAAVVIRFGMTALADTMQRNATFMPAMREQATKMNWPKAPAGPAPSIQRDRTTMGRATFMNLGFWNDDGEFTFYRLSPREYQAAAEGLPAQLIYPVVAVNMSGRVFYAAVEQLAAIFEARTR